MSEREKAVLEIQDELLQQKDALLKDIRVIQKRKIKEMEELYDIKLKKKALEQDLENTKQEIKRVEQQNSLLKNKGVVAVSKGIENLVQDDKSKRSDIEIIDQKETTSLKVDIDRSLRLDPIRVKANLVEGINSPYVSQPQKEAKQHVKVPPWYWDPEPTQRMENNKSLENHGPEMPALQHRKPTQEEASRSSASPLDVPEDRQSFVPYKRIRFDSSNHLNQHVTHLSEGLKDTVLIPINLSSPRRSEPNRERQESLPVLHDKVHIPPEHFRQLPYPHHPPIIPYHHMIHPNLYQSEQNLQASQFPIRPTPRSIAPFQQRGPQSQPADITTYSDQQVSRKSELEKYLLEHRQRVCIFHVYAGKQNCICLLIIGNGWAEKNSSQTCVSSTKT